ncbi:MAG TPA: lipopolysaccharide heptosyltransferase II [Deltaproteobacteria bacterium]|nr:lipopolysaccharide heptosyltransferase II [Deltaproteobacteria bacterium]
MNILIVKLSAVGDVIHTLPSLSLLREAFPDAHITWVVEESAADLLLGHPQCDRVLISGRKRWIADLRRGRRIAGTIADIRSFLADLRDRRYDIAIDFHGLFKSAVIMGFAGAHRKIGYRSMQEMSQLFYSETVHEDMAKHAVLRYLDFIAYLGIPVSEPRFVIPGGSEERERVDRMLVEAGIEREQKFVAVSPVALWNTKLWYNDRFAFLGDRITDELAMPVVFTGGPDAIGVVHDIRRRMSAESVDLAGETSLRELARLYERAALVVSTDSGPMHLAAAVGTPTVALFGPTDPGRTGPFGEGHRVIRTGIECSPCFRKECDSRACMAGITVEAVFDAVRERLE